MNLTKSTKLIGLAAILCGGLLLSMKNLPDPQPTEATTQQDLTPAKVVLITILDGKVIPPDSVPERHKVKYARTERSSGVDGDTVKLFITTN